MSEVTRLTPERSGADIVRDMLAGGGALRRHPPKHFPPRGIVKDTDNVYKARTVGLDVELMSRQDLAMKVNALELTLSKVLGEVQYLRGRITSDPSISHGVRVASRGDPYITSNVISMRSKSSATQTSVSGNEAESLYEEPTESFELPSPPKKVEPALKLANTELRYLPYMGRVHPIETVRRLSTITDVSADTVADIAWRHGLDLVELADLAYAEYTRRELSCYEHYGQARDDVQFARLTAQHGLEDRVDVTGTHEFHTPDDSRFAAWDKQVQQYEGSLRLIANEKLAANDHTYTRTHPLVPGEVVARQRIVNRQKDEARVRIAQLRGSVEEREGFHEIEMVSNRLHVPRHSVTTSSQIAGLHTAWHELCNKVRAWHGMCPKLRSSKLRDLYASDPDPNTSKRERLGYWKGANWWEYNASYQGEIKPVWVKTRQTVHTERTPTERWHQPDLCFGRTSRRIEDLQPRDRMNAIGNLLVSHGLNDPLHVSAMQAHLLAYFGDSVLSNDGVKPIKLGTRRSQHEGTYP